MGEWTPAWGSGWGKRAGEMGRGMWGVRSRAREFTYFLADEVGGGVVEEGFEDGHESVFVLAEEAEGQFAGFAEGSCGGC